jgi:hypothetical protein
MVTLANRDHRQGGGRLEEPSWTSPLFAASPRSAGWDLQALRGRCSKSLSLGTRNHYPKFGVSTNGLNTHPGNTIHSTREGRVQELQGGFTATRLLGATEGWQ